MGRSLDNNYENVNRTQIWLFCIYIFLSFFETYLVNYIGHGTKYYLLGVLFLFLYEAHFKIKTNKYWCFYLIWLLFKLLSVAWSNMANTDFNTHLMSHLGMVLLVIIMTGRKQNKHLLYAILQTSLWVSFLFGILSIVFRGSYIDERFVARQVLTLFGRQNDPNNCAAFLLVGITLGLYSSIVEREKVIFNAIVVVVNSFALMLTSSRGGLVSLGGVIACMLLFPKPRKKFPSKKVIGGIAVTFLICIIAVYIVQNYLPQANLNRLLVLSGYKGGSGRDYSWRIGFQMFLEKPLFGWGWGGYSTTFGAIHNTFLTSLCDIGIVGTFFFITPIIMIIIDCVKQKSLLALLLLLSGVLPSIIIEAINKRFFWNAIVLSIMLVLYQKENSEKITVWGFIDQDKETGYE